MSNELLYWLENLIILGHEDDPKEDEEEGQEEEGDEGDEGDEEGDKGGKDGDDPEEGEDDELTKKVTDLEAALAKERKLRRTAEREARKNKRTPKKTTETKKTEDSELQKQLDAAAAQTQRLAEGLKKKEVDDAILAAARKAGFIDETDALTDDIRKKVDVDQDPEDPTDIDIDEDSVEEAVKDLAARKKHLVGKATPGTPSGTKFKRGTKKPDADAQALVSNYPSLG